MELSSRSPPSPGEFVSLLTPPGRGAVATLVVEGQHAGAMIARFFQAAGGATRNNSPLGQIVFGRWSGGRDAAEELVVCRRSPTRVEVHCHGGDAAAAAILGDLLSAGCQCRSWQEWVARIEPDRLAAEARADLAEARTERAAAILLDQYRGALRQALDEIDESLATNPAEAITRLETLALYAPVGLHLTQPWKIVLAGPPNVGKSSLINALLGYPRSIVFDRPGTTRDVVSATTAFDGWPVELSDTAGLRTGRDALESAGIERARAQAAVADLVLLVLDVNDLAANAAEDFAAGIDSARKLVVLNKCDLAPAARRDAWPANGVSGWRVSALTGTGIPELPTAIVSQLVPRVPPPGAAVPFRLAHVAAVSKALALARTGKCEG